MCPTYQTLLRGPSFEDTADAIHAVFEIGRHISSPSYHYIADVITYEKPAFLCELLDEIGRKDLVEEVKKYLEKAESEYIYIAKNVCTHI